MPQVNPELLIWARETAGLTREEAIEKLDIRDARGVAAVNRLAALEEGEEAPSRAMLVKMAKQYRRPLLAFYMVAPPPKGDRGQDFRTLPIDHSVAADALLDVLIRDVRARQSLVRSALEDEDEVEPRPFVGSLRMTDGVARAVRSVRAILNLELAQFRAQATVEEAFAALRNASENAGVFVLLIGDLGSHHTAIDLETFRGFALADPIAPFIVINDHDARSAWSFTLLHELVHLLLGTTGVSGNSTEGAIERFCNDVASEFLLPSEELAALDVNDRTDVAIALQRIAEFTRGRHLSRAMVAYKLHRIDAIRLGTWRRLHAALREEWFREQAHRRERVRERDGGPNYYVVRRHRLGSALLRVVKRTMSDGILTPSKAGKVLGVKPRNVEPLLTLPAPGRGRAA